MVAASWPRLQEPAIYAVEGCANGCDKRRIHLSSEHEESRRKMAPSYEFSLRVTLTFILQGLVQAPHLWVADPRVDRRFTWMDLFVDLIFVAAAAEVVSPLRQTTWAYAPAVILFSALPEAENKTRAE